MRTIGAIILIICGVALIGYNIYSFYEAILVAQEIGFGVANQTQISNLILLIYDGACVLAGLAAIWAGIRRRSNFIVSFIGFIIFAIVVVYLVSAWTSGTIGDMQVIINLVVGFTLPIMYLVGSFLIKF